VLVVDDGDRVLPCRKPERLGRLAVFYGESAMHDGVAGLLRPAIRGCKDGPAGLAPGIAKTRHMDLQRAEWAAIRGRRITRLILLRPCRGHSHEDDEAHAAQGPAHLAHSLSLQERA